MQAEQQQKPLQTPEIANQTNSGDSKPKQRGGRRPGAGRPPNLAKQLLKGFTRETVAEAAANIDCWTVINGLLKSKSERIRLETLAFIRDWLYGRPAQSVQVSGGMLHAHTVWRPLADLSDEEMRLLDTITKKLSGPTSNALPDAPQNQIESKPAIEAEVVDSQP